MARPTKYTPELDAEICERLAAGESLNAICKDDHVPHRVNIMRWLLATDNPVYDKFRINYALAREIQYQNMADDILDIADDGRNDWMEKLDQDGQAIGYSLNGEHVQRSRLRVDTRKWFMSKVLPKFADKKEEAATDSDKLIDAVSSLIDKLPN